MSPTAKADALAAGKAAAKLRLKARDLHICKLWSEKIAQIEPVMDLIAQPTLAAGAIRGHNALPRAANGAAVSQSHSPQPGTSKGSEALGRCARPATPAA